MTRIYKILTGAEWDAAVAAGRFEGAAVDRQDGFIHFSTAAQAAETARRHFAGRTGLVIVAFDADRLGETLKWEPSRGGDLFPHLYGALDPGLAEGVNAVLTGDDGAPDLGVLAP